MSRLKPIVMLALAASVLGTYADTVSGVVDEEVTIQGNFEAGGSTVLLVNNSNRDRVGAGGGGGAQRINQQIQGFLLPTIPAGDGINEATFSFKMASTAVSGAPLNFDMVVCLMNATDISEITTDDFMEATAPVNSTLGNGIVIGQLAVADVSNNENAAVSLTGAALTQLSSLYAADGTPTQAHVYFRLSTSAPVDFADGDNDNDRFNLDDNGNTGPVVRSLVMGTGEPIPQVYYVASTPKPWTDGTAWSDGNAATAGVDYFVTNNVALQTPAVTATFPGKSLSLVGSQRVELMVSGSDVITFDSLALDGDVLAAGAVGAGEAQVDGVIDMSSDATLSGSADNSRGLRVLSVISGASTVELSAPTQTIYIDNTNNTFNGTWVVSGGAGEFSGNQAVGSASIEVQSNATLRILGDWQGLAKNDSLTVADSPNALVDLGTNAWTVTSLTIGTNVVADATYTAIDLNALSANAVFTGSTGTIQVGPPPPPPQPPILVGWERWTGGAGSTSVATVETNGFTGTASNGSAFNQERFAACTDGTFGTLLTPEASKVQAAEEGLRLIGATDVWFDFTIANTSGTDVSLGAFHFDALTKTVSAGRPDAWSLEVLSGDISIGEVATNALGFVAATSNLDDYDVDLTGLADHTLEAGGSVVFRLSITGGTAGNTAKLDIDNVALTQELIIIPSEPPVMGAELSGGNMVITWSEGGFKLQTRETLSFGDWVDVPGGATSPVAVPATNDVEFLRLIQQ